jgi:multiple sugar transport system ATP-binding protein
MKDGFIQQIGKPIDLYNRPVNRFVAEFIGAPPMQFLSGSIVKNEEKFIFQGNGFALNLQGQCEAASEIYLGIRPENLHLCTENIPGSFSAQVLIVENIGSEAIIHCEVGHEKIAIKIPVPQTLPAIGEILFVIPGKGHLHIFAKGSEKTIAVVQLSL